MPQNQLLTERIFERAQAPIFHEIRVMFEILKFNTVFFRIAIFIATEFDRLGKTSPKPERNDLAVPANPLLRILMIHPILNS